jgi:minor extracellular serine protease Vpr
MRSNVRGPSTSMSSTSSNTASNTSSNASFGTKATSRILRLMSFGISMLAFTTSLTGCSADRWTEKFSHQLIQSHSPEDLWPTDLWRIFSTRPDPETHSYFLIKLDAPALFAQQPQPTQEQVLALNEAQDQVLKKLHTLSSEIKVIYRYRFVVNGFAVVAPTSLLKSIGQIAGVARIERAIDFARPIIEANTPDPGIKTSPAFDRTSAKFIGALEAHARGIRGQGLRVGIIDSGIDYTHKMFGGIGTADAFKAIDPSAPHPSYPNAKVVGGLDFVGTEYNTSSPLFEKRIPKVDQNPLDEGGHGTHVAGSVAGIGDGVKTYDGVAPDALLYALKVFGAQGSTNDTVVVAALEFAADPNGDGNPNDRLDVVNLSLGSGFGDGQILYNEAISNLATGGTSVVASGGNSGDTPFIVGAPGVADAAISVAASVDNADTNWRFRAARVLPQSAPEFLVEAIEGTITKPLADAGQVEGEALHIGLAAQDLSPETAALVQGKIALIDRGQVSFADKIRRAEAAGAIGVVMLNNQDGDAIRMGGGDTDKFNIPSIMLTKAMGERLKEILKTETIRIELTSTRVIERPELIDTITGFSSRGPRSIDGRIKPEISAPGAKILSAAMGSGDEGVEMSGTSMAAPHMAGVMTLLHQAYPKLSVAERKALVMNRAKPIRSANGDLYSVARQGAGRVRIVETLDSQALISPAALSLGSQQVESQKTLLQQVEVRALHQDLQGNWTLEDHTPNLRMQAPHPVTVKAQETQRSSLRFTLIQPPNTSANFSEASGFAVLRDKQGTALARVPVLALLSQVSPIEVTDLKVRSTSAADSTGAVVDFEIKNAGVHDVEVLPFNLISRDPRKPDPIGETSRSRYCDLELAAYRVQPHAEGARLQVAIKLYEPMTTWDLCEFSLLLDRDNDAIADQELAGARMDSLAGFTETRFASLLLDVPMIRQIRTAFEQALKAPRPPQSPEPKLDFRPALLNLGSFSAKEFSTIAFIEAPIELLTTRADGSLQARIGTSAQTGSAIEPDDFLNAGEAEWFTLNLRPEAQGFGELPSHWTLSPGQTQALSIVKGAGPESLVLLSAKGRHFRGGVGQDQQAFVPRITYQP